MNRTTQKNDLVPQNLIDRTNRPPLKKVVSIVHRPGSLVLLDKPSRIGQSLFYPDGRQVKDE